jgi:hypothetical protein
MAPGVPTSPRRPSAPPTIPEICLPGEGDLFCVNPDRGVLTKTGPCWAVSFDLRSHASRAALCRQLLDGALRIRSGQTAGPSASSSTWRSPITLRS